MSFNGELFPVNASVIDSPSTTSSVTYKVQAAVTNSSGTSDAFVLNKFGVDDNVTIYSRTVSSITVMEISG